MDGLIRSHPALSPSPLGLCDLCLPRRSLGGGRVAAAQLAPFVVVNNHEALARVNVESVARRDPISIPRCCQACGFLVRSARAACLLRPAAAELRRAREVFGAGSEHG
jgi:hypothetical protein